MLFRRLFTTLFLGLVAGTCLVQAQTLSDSARISLLTCTPGQAVYERYGHTALLVYDAPQDIHWVFNYGMFSFDTDNFYYKFIKGETYYQLGVEDYRSFLVNYNIEGREVYEQELNLSRDERQALFDALLLNYRPDNRYYLYNFVFDNCATRPLALIRQTLGDTITSNFRGYTGLSYREFIHHYTGSGSWADFGINMLFGARADEPMQGTASLFLPEEVMLYLADAHRADGTALVRSQSVRPFSPRHTPWYTTWYVGMAFFFVLLVVLSRIDRRRGKFSWWFDLICVILYLGCVGIVFFLVHYSIHPLVGYNWRLAVLPVLHLCARLSYFLP